MLLKTRVNGELRQEQNTNELIVSSLVAVPLVAVPEARALTCAHFQFDIPTLIETASLGITLQPGDVIATGTPGMSRKSRQSNSRAYLLSGMILFTAGVGIGRQPPIFLQPGDKIEVEIGNLGILCNEVAEKDSKTPKCEPVRRSAVQYA